MHFHATVDYTDNCRLLFLCTFKRRHHTECVRLPMGSEHVKSYPWDRWKTSFKMSGCLGQQGLTTLKNAEMSENNANMHKP